jgi:hypothetical protein
VPRDEVVTSLHSPNDHPEREFDVVLDLSGLELDNSTFDAGVTSGADPSTWDPIDIDQEGRVDSCVDEGGKGGDKSAAVCQAQEQARDKSH